MIKQALVALILIAAAVIVLAARPIIWGTPSAQATVGVRYTFTPGASDADGDRLIFWIQRRPSWASFDWRTGTLTGIPSTDDIGLYTNIVIGVSDTPERERVTWLPTFNLQVNAAQNRRPVISGTPPPIAVVGQPYNFLPVASDPDGDTLTFWIRYRPAWATIDRATGRLYGTPSAGDVGVYADISIGATDGARNASLAPFSITVVSSAAGSATLTWTPPTTRTDGSVLTNLAGYRILWGTTPGNYPSSIVLTNPGLSSYVVSNLAPATYYFVIVAIDSNGLESGYSNVAQKTIGP